MLRNSGDYFFTSLPYVNTREILALEFINITPIILSDQVFQRSKKVFRREWITEYKFETKRPNSTAKLLRKISQLGEPNPFLATFTFGLPGQQGGQV